MRTIARSFISRDANKHSRLFSRLVLTSGGCRSAELPDEDVSSLVSSSIVAKRPLLEKVAREIDSAALDKESCHHVDASYGVLHLYGVLVGAALT